jgi:hypothetical protein
VLAQAPPIVTVDRGGPVCVLHLDLQALRLAPKLMKLFFAILSLLGYFF